MRVTVHLPAPLRPLARNRPRVRVEVDGTTVADLLAALRQEHPDLAGALLDEQGGLRRHVKLYVGDEDTWHAGRGSAPLQADVHVVVPVVL
ncbi:MoaD/ThiS family protein [bacterium]|nr:MoaD/ThiS family protein [bacterium]